MKRPTLIGWHTFYFLGGILAGILAWDRHTRDEVEDCRVWAAFSGDAMPSSFRHLQRWQRKRESQ